MTMRIIFLKIHLYLGLCAAIFLVILGVTGSITAFEESAELWLNGRLHYVPAAGKPLSEGELIEKVNRAIAPAEVVFAKRFQDPTRSHIMLTIEPNVTLSASEASSANWRNWVARGNGRAAVFVNPSDASLLGRYTAVPANQKILSKIHQFHMRLAPDPRSWGTFGKIGREVVDYSGLILCFLVPTGVVLWWRTKRGRIKWSGQWFRVFFDVHNVAGIYAAVFLFIAAVTGVVASFDSVNKAIFRVTGSTQVWHSGGPDSVPVVGAVPISTDQAIGIARQQLPEAEVDGVVLPRAPKQSFIVLMRVPEEVTDSVHSSVVVDQYSGKPLQVLNFKTDSFAYRVMRFNRAIHTGDIFGMPSRIVASVSSLLLVVMAITGVVIWWRKLAV
ncbi:MAG: PepSY domain-containing protein [Candidatus Solibacter usitatus]|nr:PepSY domain-containing protein [Candidatus Solibacter usitatus]